MGKTNKERFTELHASYLNSAMTRKLYSIKGGKLLDKAENRGRCKANKYLQDGVLLMLDEESIGAFCKKHAPQFDAEKVKIMIGFLRKNTYAAGKYNHPIDNEASELVYHNILAALGIE